MTFKCETGAPPRPGLSFTIVGRISLRGPLTELQMIFIASFFPRFETSPRYAIYSFKRRLFYTEPACRRAPPLCPSPSAFPRLAGRRTSALPIAEKHRLAVANNTGRRENRLKTGDHPKNRASRTPSLSIISRRTHPSHRAHSAQNIYSATGGRTRRNN